jgi:hypothetical protein
MPQGPCFNQLWSEIILKNVTPRRADNRVKKTCCEYYLISPGTVFREVPITLTRAMLVGIDEEGRRILMPFRKPCYGTSLYTIDSDLEEIARLRSDLTPAPVRKEKAGKRRKSPE